MCVFLKCWNKAHGKGAGEINKLNQMRETTVKTAVENNKTSLMKLETNKKASTLVTASRVCWEKEALTEEMLPFAAYGSAEAALSPLAQGACVLTQQGEGLSRALLWLLHTRAGQSTAAAEPLVTGGFPMVAFLRLQAASGCMGLLLAKPQEHLHPGWASERGDFCLFSSNK